MPFKSKGMFDQAAQKAEHTLKMLREASKEGSIPIYCNTSPCVMRLKEHIAEDADSLTLHEPVEFLHSHLLDHLTPTPKPEPVALHVT